MALPFRLNLVIDIWFCCQLFSNLTFIIIKLELIRSYTLLDCDLNPYPVVKDVRESRGRLPWLSCLRGMTSILFSRLKFSFFFFLTGSPDEDAKDWRQHCLCPQYFGPYRVICWRSKWTLEKVLFSSGSTECFIQKPRGFDQNMHYSN